MSLVDTREIATAKIVMVGGGGGGGSYTAGNGISITNNVITNTRKGALTGVIDSISSNIAHTQIDNALTTTTAGALVVLKAEASGTSIDTVRVQYGSQASESSDFRLRDTSGNYTTIDVASGDTIIMMLNATGYQMIVLSILGASTGGGYAGLGIGKKTGVTSNVIDTDIDLHRAPIVGDRLLVYFDEKVTNPTGFITYNNGTAVTSNLENVTPLYINAGWNILEFKNDEFLSNNVWVRKQNVPMPNNTLVGLSDTAIVSPSDGQLLTYDNETQKWKNKTYVEANMGFSDTELKKLKVGNVVYDTDGLRDYFVSSIANNNITISVLNSNQFVMENIAINTGNHSGSSNGWNLVLNDGMNPVSVALKNADGSPFADDIHENELLFVYVDTAGNVARVLEIHSHDLEILKDAIITEKTASGNPLTVTDALPYLAENVVAEITPIQDLHGYDKPWVGGAGKNKWGNGNISGTRVVSISPLSYPLPAGTYTFSAVVVSSDTDDTKCLIYDTTNNVNLGKIDRSVGGARVSITFSTASEITSLNIYASTSYAGSEGDTFSFTDIQIESGSTATSYAPYSNVCPITGFSSVVITDVDAESQTATVTVALGQTVYGGTLDLTSGELTITHANIASYNGETTGEPWISSMDEYTEGGTPTTGAQVVYTLASPTTTTLTAEQLALVKGYNQLSCNSGDMEITYKASGLDALKERVDELEDAVADLETDMASKTENSVVGTVENGTTASQPYAVGEHFIRNDKFCTCISAIASGATLTLNTNYVEGTIADNITKRVNYSATEHVIGTWINGETLYEKTIYCGNLPNSTEKLIDANIGVSAKAVSISGIAMDTDGSSFPIVFVFPSDITWSIAAYYYPSNYQTAQYRDKIRIITAKNLSNVTAYMTIQYIKL